MADLVDDDACVRAARDSESGRRVTQNTQADATQRSSGGPAASTPEAKSPSLKGVKPFHRYMRQSGRWPSTCAGATNPR